MALLHGMYQIYNSGLGVQGFPSRLGFSIFSVVSVMGVEGERWCEG